MNRPGFVFFRGSTPQISLLLPVSVDASADVVWCTLSQGGKTVREYAMNGGETGGVFADARDPHRVFFRMSQEDTLAFLQGDCEMQVRVRIARTGAADTFVPVPGFAGAARKEGVI